MRRRAGPRRRAIVLVACCFTIAARAGPLDFIYDDAELLPLRRSYERGWRDNVENVFRPVLTKEEQSRLGGIRLEVELRVPGREPVAYMAGGTTVIFSAASLKFLEDIAMAHTWLDGRGLSTQSLGDYLLMLRSWRSRHGASPPPKPWDALCVPANAYDVEPLAGRARRVFDSAAAFALLHEYGHVFHGHPGSLAVAPAVSRANEEEADRFALDIFARIGEVPLGVTLLFFTMAHLQEEDENPASATHPVSPERLQSLARHLTASAAAYRRGFEADGQVKALAVALEVAQLALLLGDRDVGELSARIARTVEPQDLAPRARGRHLAPPCNGQGKGDAAFDGAFHGTITAGATPLEIDVVLDRKGDEVTGRYSFGAGFGRIENGIVAGTRADYVWSLPPDRGRASLTLRDGRYLGTWGGGASSSGAGSIDLTRDR